MLENELWHHGVLGMKWGVHRAVRKSSANRRLENKAMKYDSKAIALSKKSEKAHSKNDLGRSNKSAMKASKYNKKAVKFSKKSLNADNPITASLYNQRKANAEFKAAQYQAKANRLSITTGYGIKAANYYAKSDKAKIKAAKTRLQIETNKRFIELTKRKVSEMNSDDLAKSREWLEQQIQKIGGNHVVY